MANIYAAIDRPASWRKVRPFFDHILVNYASASAGVFKIIKNVRATGEKVNLISDPGAFSVSPESIEKYLHWSAQYCDYTIIPDFLHNAKATYALAFECLDLNIVKRDKVVIVIQENKAPPKELEGYKLALGGCLFPSGMKANGLKYKRNWEHTLEGLEKFKGTLFFGLGLGHKPALLKKYKVKAGDSSSFVYKIHRDRQKFVEYLGL